MCFCGQNCFIHTDLKIMSSDLGLCSGCGRTNTPLVDWTIIFCCLGFTIWTPMTCIFSTRLLLTWLSSVYSVFWHNKYVFIFLSTSDWIQISGKMTQNEWRAKNKIFTLSLSRSLLKAPSTLARNEMPGSQWCTLQLTSVKFQGLPALPS